MVKNLLRLLKSIKLCTHGHGKTTCIRQGFWHPSKQKIESYLNHSIWIVLLDE